MTPLALHAHGWSLQVLPHLGGSIGLLQHEGRDILRRAPAQVTNVLETGGFPLVPYANRIADGAFDFQDRSYRLPRNFGDHPHSLHGFGWHSAWQEAERTGTSVSLVQHHREEAGWPWPYTAEQRFKLAPRTVTITLSLCNSGGGPMPAGLGLHPYFPIRASTRLRFASTWVWLTDANQLPTAPVDPAHFGDWSAGESATGPDLVDNTYQGWSMSAQLLEDDGTIELAAAGAEMLHVYRPPDAGFICLEPVTHLPDAINRGCMPVLEPGETGSISLTISVRNAAV